MYMPGVMYRRGDITKNAPLNIPLQLRRKIWAIYIWLFVNVGFLAALYYAVKIAKYPIRAKHTLPLQTQALNHPCLPAS
jgi:hypothetical protein